MNELSNFDASCSNLKRLSLVVDKENIPDNTIISKIGKNEKMPIKIVKKNKLKKIDEQEIKKRKVVSVEYKIQNKLAIKIQRSFRRYKFYKKMKRLVIIMNVKFAFIHSNFIFTIFFV